MKIIDRYIQAAVLQATGVVLLVVAGLSLVSTFIGEADNLGGDYTLLRMLEYVLLSMPDNIHIVFPVAALLGALSALGALAAGSELVVIRATGVSARRLAWSVARAGLVLAVISALFAEILGPWGVAYGEQVRDRARHGQQVQKIGDGLWVRDADRFVRIRGTLAQDTLVGILVYARSDRGQLRSVLTAERAGYDAGEWTLYDIQRSGFGADGVRVEHIDSMPWDVTISPEVLQLSVVKPEELSSLGLYRYIDYLRDNDVVATDYSLALWRNLVAPFTVLVLCVFALPFAFGSLRSAGAGQRLFAGGLAGVVFYMVNEITAAGGVVYGLPPWLAASLPTMALAVATVVWLRRMG